MDKSMGIGTLRWSGCCGVLAVALALGACSKSPASTSAAPSASAAGAASGASNAGAGNVTAQPSESIATNVADPNCPDCQRADAASTRDVAIVPLDPVFRDDLKLTISKSSEVLEDGVAILEKNVKQPEAAQAALAAYREKNKAKMDELAIKTKDMAVRLQALGYESEIPEEVRAGYEERMGKVLARLEAVRAVYAKHPQVLETFGPFIRSGE
jgi:hypothetical protein